MSFLLFFLLQPTLVSGSLESRGVAADIERRILEGAQETFWAGYAVPAQAGRSHGCDGVVHLESGRTETRREPARAPSELIVLYRIADGDIEEVRTVSELCRIDASDRTVYWWTGVSTEASLELLSRLVREEPSSKLGKRALHAIAGHRGAQVDELLTSFATADWPREIREDAVFWLGANRGATGFERLSTLFESETDRGIREKIVFALHVSEAPGAAAKLIEIARNDHASNVREQALFWLAQEAGDHASETIAEAVREDPDIEVKKKAVFALSQLPPEEGVPLLVEVAQTHPHAEIRRKAFFWLGQSGDPRALALIERVLLAR